MKIKLAQVVAQKPSLLTMTVETQTNLQKKFYFRLPGSVENLPIIQYSVKKQSSCLYNYPQNENREDEF